MGARTKRLKEVSQTVWLRELVCVVYRGVSAITNELSRNKLSYENKKNKTNKKNKNKNRKKNNLVVIF